MTLYALDIGLRVHSLAVPLGVPDSLAEAFEQYVFGIVCRHPGQQALVGSTNAHRLVDAQLFVDGQVE